MITDRYYFRTSSINIVFSYFNRRSPVQDVRWRRPIEDFLTKMSCAAERRRLDQVECFLRPVTSKLLEILSQSNNIWSGHVHRFQ